MNLLIYNLTTADGIDHKDDTFYPRCSMRIRQHVVWCWCIGPFTALILLAPPCYTIPPCLATASVTVSSGKHRALIHMLHVPSCAFSLMPQPTFRKCNWRLRAALMKLGRPDGESISPRLWFRRRAISGKGRPSSRLLPWRKWSNLITERAADFLKSRVGNIKGRFFIV